MEQKESEKRTISTSHAIERAIRTLIERHPREFDKLVMQHQSDTDKEMGISR